MIYSISGIIIAKKEQYVIVGVRQIALRVFVSQGTSLALPETGNEVLLFCTLYIREESSFELYGFMSEKEMHLFERLNAISGIGPKSALGILSVAKIDQLVAAINEGKSDLLTRTSGIGKKTAERIVLELKGKLDIVSSQQTLTLMESDIELEETLVSLGYTKADAKRAIAHIDPKIISFKDRLRAALKKNDK